MTRKGDWMQTYTGKQFWPLDPRPEEIDIRDIAHSLSLQCRYNGHCLKFYSVAEHSVLVARAAPIEHKMAALLHDAAEAYLCDLPRPIKRSVTGYAEAEAVMEAAIAEKFGFQHPLPDVVKDLDNRILLDERDQIMASPPADWNLPFVPLGVEVYGWQPREAKLAFMGAFEAFTLSLADGGDDASH